MRFAALASLLAIAACAKPPSGLLDARPVHLDATYHRVLVVGVGEDEASRRRLEAAFASYLPGATPASSVIGGFGQPGVADIAAAEARLGADAVLAVRLLPVSQHSDSSPGYVYGLPASAMPVGFAGFYRNAIATGAGHFEAASLELDLWAVRTDSLAWSALTPVFTPTDAATITASAAQDTGLALQPPLRR